MTGSDFNRLPEGPVVMAIIAYTLIVIGLWEVVEAVWPHIHLSWK